MRVRPRSGVDGRVGGFLEPAQAHQRHGACAEHAEEQRVERAGASGTWRGLKIFSADAALIEPALAKASSPLGVK